MRAVAPLQRGAPGLRRIRKFRLICTTEDSLLDLTRNIPMATYCRTMAFVLAILAMMPAAAADPEYVIRIKNHQFIPAELIVPAGVKFQVVVDNQDDNAEEFESYSLNREKHIPPKSRVTLFIGPLDAGRYVYQGEDRASGTAASLGVIEAR